MSKLKKDFVDSPMVGIHSKHRFGAGAWKLSVGRMKLISRRTVMSQIGTGSQISSTTRKLVFMAYQNDLVAHAMANILPRHRQMSSFIPR
jgi:hypothetical protein